jgi:hypothetical protein
MAHEQSPSAAVAVANSLPVGAAVRVKKGVKDPDFPDMPLGGWAGTVIEVDAATPELLYRVEWNAFTLENMHPICRTRCERDGLDLTCSWLGADDLEPDSGQPPDLEPPQVLHARPLNPALPEDVVRTVFKLTTADPLPAVDLASLRRYYEFLNGNLTFPMLANRTDGVIRSSFAEEPYRIVELIRPNKGETERGLCCWALRGEERVELPLTGLEARSDDRSRQFIADYAFWFSSHGCEDERNDPAPETPLEEAAAQGRRTVLNAISRCGLYGAATGAAVGALIATETGVLFAMGVGAITAAVVGYVAGTRYGFFFGKVNRINSGPILGGIFGIIGGAVAGAIAGALLIGYMGTILGSILGALLGQGLQFLSKRLPGPILCGFAGTVVGAIAWSWTLDMDRTLTGVLYGMAAGAAAGLFLSAGFFGTLLLIEMNREDGGA